MGELTTGHVLLDAALIVVMMLVLDWVESKRNRSAGTRQDCRGQYRSARGQLDVRTATKAA